jgi:hypothetical protein
MLSITDPGNNFAFDAHQYLDSDSSGQSAQIVRATIGQERLVTFTNWLRTNNRRGFLGEFAVANSQIGDNAAQIGDEAIHNMLNYMEANDDVWLGWTWWAAGPWWGNYMFSIEPTNLGQPNQADRPALAVLQSHFAVAQQNLPGDYSGDGAVDAADYIIWRNTLAQSGNGLAADGNVNDVIDNGDYDVWRAHFGETLSGRAGAIADSIGGLSSIVPEPKSAFLMITCVMLSLFSRDSVARPRDDG